MSSYQVRHGRPILTIFMLALLCSSCEDITFVGCFRYPESTSHIQYGKYIPRSLSTYSCASICEKNIGSGTHFSLSKQSFCHCDTNLEDFKITEQVPDKYCRNFCKNSLEKTEYCGQNNTMAVYTDTMSYMCNVSVNLTNGRIKLDDSLAHVTCDHGYIISGNSDLVCQRSNGSWTWNAPFPRCSVAEPTEDGKMFTFISLVAVVILLFLITLVCSYALVSMTTSNRTRRWMGFLTESTVTEAVDQTDQMTNDTNETVLPISPIPRQEDRNVITRVEDADTSSQMGTNISCNSISGKYVLEGEYLALKENSGRNQDLILGRDGEHARERESASSSRTRETTNLYHEKTFDFHEIVGYECLRQTNKKQHESIPSAGHFESQHVQPAVKVRSNSKLSTHSPKYASVKSSHISDNNELSLSNIVI